MLKRVIACDFIPEGTDLGLLALRVIAGTTLLLKHGLEKVQHFGMMSAHFPDPLHIGATTSLTIAMIGDFACSILVILGLGTRWVAAWSLLTIWVAWSFVHHFLFFGRGADHGELMVLYMAAMLTLVLTGAGRYSVDGALRK